MTLPEFAEQLLEWYRINRRSLPWRDADRTPYTVWVSEVMLQQTQVSRVIPYYSRFLERFPVVSDLAQASWEEFLPYYQGLGYYARGRNMLKTAQIVNSRYNGIFPAYKRELIQLPGVGDYTADAILSFGYGQQKLAVDTNVKRILGEFLGSEKINWEHVRKELDPLAPDINSAFMDYASAHKKPRPKIEKDTFPWKSAQTYLVLHENHEKYFSENSERFSPFLLPEPVNSRSAIKEYFSRNLGLELSVRPPRAHGYLDEKPAQIVFAQILSGENSLSVFPKMRAKPVIQEILNSLR